MWVQSDFRDPPPEYSILIARLAVMLLLGLGVLGMAFLTWYIATSSTGAMIDRLGRALRRQALAQSAAHVHSELSSLATAASLLSHLLTRQQRPQLFGGSGGTEVLPLTWTVYTTIPNITSLGLFATDGRAEVYVELPSGPILLRSNNSAGGVPWQAVAVDGNGVPTGPASSVPAAPGSAVAAFVNGPPSPFVFWSVESVAMFGPSLVAACAILDGQGRRIGAAVAQGPTSALSLLLSELQQTMNLTGALLYVTSKEGVLLAVSDHSSVQEASSGGLLQAVHSPSAVIREAATFLQSQSEQCFSNVQLGGESFYVDTTWVEVGDLQVVGTILVPHASILGPIESRNRLTLIVIGCTAAAIFLLGCLLVLAFTKRVSREMALRLELIRQLEAKRRAEASSEHKTAFMANMSHELRTPMAAIIGLVDILLTEESLSGDQQQLIGQVKRCSLALLALLNNILDLSKVEAGKLEVEQAQFELRAEVEDVVDMFSVQALGGGVEIALAMDGEHLDRACGVQFSEVRVQDQRVYGRRCHSGPGDRRLCAVPPDPGQPHQQLPEVHPLRVHCR